MEPEFRVGYKMDSYYSTPKSGGGQHPASERGGMYFLSMAFVSVPNNLDVDRKGCQLIGQILYFISLCYDDRCIREKNKIH